MAAAVVAWDRDHIGSLYGPKIRHSRSLSLGRVQATRSGGMALPPGTTATIWARDMAACVFDQNLYGSHPFALALAPSGAASGLFLRNSNGMDVLYAPDGASPASRHEFSIVQPRRGEIGFYRLIQLRMPPVLCVRV